MAHVAAPSVDVDVDWPLIAGVGLILAALVWIIYDVFNKSGAAGAVGAASNTVQSAANLAQAPLDAVTGAINTVTGKDITTPGSNSNLLYSGVSSLFSCGSIYGCQ